GLELPAPARSPGNSGERVRPGRDRFADEIGTSTAARVGPRSGHAQRCAGIRADRGPLRMTILSCWTARSGRSPRIVSGLLGVGLALAPAACGSVAATADGQDASFGPGSHKEGGSPDTGRLG